MSPRDEPGNVVIDAGPRIGAEELYQSTIVARGARRLRIEGRELGEHLRLLLRCEIAAPNLIDISWAGCIHQDATAGRDRILDGEVDLVRAAGHGADGPDGRV